MTWPEENVELRLDAEPATAEPATAEPATAEPATAEPATAEQAEPEPAEPEPAAPTTVTPETTEAETATAEPAVPATTGTAASGTAASGTAASGTAASGTAASGTAASGTAVGDTAEPAEPPAAEPATAQPEPAQPEPAQPEPAQPEPAQPAAAETAPETAGSGPVAVPEPDHTLEALAAIGAEVADLGNRLGELAEATAELGRLRTRDTDLIARLHDDVTKLRNGEIATALNPVVTGMIKLHDQMVSLGARSDPASPVGMLHTQLLQIMELTCAVKPFSPVAGDRFDARLHTGSRRVATADPAADGTIAGTIRPGFVRADGSIVRVADVEVHRLSG